MLIARFSYTMTTTEVCEETITADSPEQLYQRLHMYNNGFETQSFKVSNKITSGTVENDKTGIRHQITAEMLKNVDKC